MNYRIVCLTCLFYLSSIAHAQFAADQSRSLAGAESVHVVFGPGIVGNSTLYNSVTLELRKTGLRIEPDSADIILNVSGIASSNTLTVDVRTRLDVEQNVVISRTGEELQLVTWYYENQARVNNVNWTQETLKDKIMTGLNQFLNDFLTANGR